MSLRMPFGTAAATARSLAVGCCLSLIGAGCMGRVNVETQVAPGANLAGRHTFQILPTPAARGLTLDSYDPMLDNSITNRGIRDHIRAAFGSRGYQETTSSPDVKIAYYASTQERFELTSWDYGYTMRGWPREYTEVTPYNQGTVIIDVVDGSTNELLWRGRGVAAVSQDPAIFDRELAKAVNVIVASYPTARYPGMH